MQHRTDSRSNNRTAAIALRDCAIFSASALRPAPASRGVFEPRVPRPAHRHYANWQSRYAAAPVLLCRSPGTAACKQTKPGAQQREIRSIHQVHLPADAVGYDVGGGWKLNPRQRKIDVTVPMARVIRVMRVSFSSHAFFTNTAFPRRSAVVLSSAKWKWFKIIYFRTLKIEPKRRGAGNRPRPAIPLRGIGWFRSLRWFPEPPRAFGASAGLRPPPAWQVGPAAAARASSAWARCLPFLVFLLFFRFVLEELFRGRTHLLEARQRPRRKGR